MIAENAEIQRCSFTEMSTREIRVIDTFRTCNHRLDSACGYPTCRGGVSHQPLFRRPIVVEAAQGSTIASIREIELSSCGQIDQRHPGEFACAITLQSQDGNVACTQRSPCKERSVLQRLRRYNHRSIQTKCGRLCVQFSLGTPPHSQAVLQRDETGAQRIQPVGNQHGGDLSGKCRGVIRCLETPKSNGGGKQT